MIEKFRCWLIIKLVGKRKVAINCKLLDYNKEQNFVSGNYISSNNSFSSIEKLIIEEMYTGSPNKKVYRHGNSFVLNIL
jgi:hypothetical protein